MKDPKLLIIGGHSGEGGGGIKTVVLEMEHHLSEHYDIKTFDQTAYYMDNFAIKILLTLWKLVTFPFQIRPDIVHINTTSGFGFYRDSVYILFIALFWRCPIVLRTGGSGFDEFITVNSVINKRYFQFILSHVSAILVLTNLQRRAISTHVSGSKIHLFRQATEVEHFSPIRESETPHILFLSSLSERKGFPLFADVIENLLTASDFTDSDVKISIAGDGRYRELAQDLQQTHNCVDYHGYITGDRKYDLYNKASIFVLPTQAEGFPNVIIEAMAAGTAIVTTTVSGIPEIVTEENGIVIDPDAQDQLHQAILELVQSPKRVEAMGKANAEVIQHNHSWSKATNQLRKIYSEILEHK